MLVLHGLNLEIADAANRSGFNTRNQGALMDLIWSVRRIAFRHAVERPKVQRPPKHPIYPDRYRPGDSSDNTNRPRKRGREQEAPRTGIGTSSNPIDLDAADLQVNDGGTAANSSAKRIKVDAGQIGRHKVELPERPKVLNPVHPTKFPNSSNGRQERGRATARTTPFIPPPRSQNLLPPRPSSDEPVFNSAGPLVAKPREITVVELQKVGNTLKDNVDAVLECSKVMEEMYSRDERLGVDTIYKELVRLKNTFDSYLGESEVGIKTVKKIVGLLEDDTDRVMTAAVDCEL